MAWKPPELEIIGNNDPKVSPYLKAWIIQENTCVCGVIGEGTSQDIIANWTSPFEDFALGQYFEKLGGAIQLATGFSDLTKAHSTQIWSGNKPLALTLVLNFYALADAQKEVLEPIKALEKMISPVFHAIMPGGRVPKPVSINIGRLTLLENCVITDMSTPLDKEKTRDGYLVRSEVQLQIETHTMLSGSDIDKMHG